MLIRRLKLSGFKSFVEPAELRIEPGLTGVVGPNGCGKSNLLEAIRWVMGENSPKSMRSGGMEDVIFAGTEARPPRDFAEVVLQGADAEGEPLEVVRRIERGAGSAYRVNGSDVRAKDVALSFADAATGAHSPALVSQGKIAQVIAAKPAERRQMLEEAAGIAGLHVRRRDAEGKLRQTETNLARLDDLMAGLDSRIAALRRQAKQAERYAELSDRIRLAEARLVYARWREAADAAEAAKREAAAAEARVTAARADADAAEKAQAVAAAALATARDRLADRRDDTAAHSHRMASLENSLETVRQRLADMDRQRQRLEDDRADADRITSEAAKALTDLEKALLTSEQDLARDEAARPSLAAALETRERANRSAELALAKASADQAGVEADWRVAQSAIAQAAAELDRLEAERLRHERLGADISGAADPQRQVEQARASLDQTRKTLGECRDKLQALRSGKEALAAERDGAAAAQAAARAELAGVEREFAALERDRAARSKRTGQTNGARRAIDELRAEPGYEKALAAALGRDAKAQIGLPEDNSDGRFWAGRDDAHNGSGVPDSLLDHTSAYPPELELRLAMIHVAAEDDGRPLQPGEWLVTHEGALRRWDGFIARGEGSAEALQLEADNRLARLERELPGLREAAEAAAGSAERAEQALHRHRQEEVAAERSLQQADEAERQALRSLDRAESEAERQKARREEMARVAENLALRHAQAEEVLASARAHLGSLTDPAAGREGLEKARNAHDDARSALQTAMARLASHDQSLAVTRERLAARRSDMAGWRARSGDAAKRLSEMGKRLADIEEEQAVLAGKPEGLERQIAEAGATGERLLRERAEAEAALAAAEKTAAEMQAAAQRIVEALASLREERATLAAKAEGHDARRIEMGRIAGERFQCPPPMLPGRFGFAEDDVKDAAAESAEMDRLTASRERIGPVNLVAAEELKELESTQGSSAEEQAELTEAVNRLRGSIGSLNREGRERLRTAFEEVDTHFRRLFTRLFEGGSAHLALVDSDDPLQAGLEIYAQPPGKRLQSLTLLSGGEQALTAIALIFALFLTNPAPICVLDEVDAPLDDANIDRFCDLLESMTAETATRYLIVTHNAVTMSRMHRLFGVTMVEKGVSRLVSVDLAAAEGMLAAE